MSAYFRETPTTPGQENSEGDRSRRSFLIRSAATAAAVPGAVLAVSGAAHAARPGSGSGSSSVFFRRLPDLYPGWNMRNLREILQDEQDHIAVLTNLLDEKPTMRPTFKNLVASTPFDFIRMAAMIENGGVGSYLQGVNAISQANHDEYLLIAGGILAVEAQHTGYLNALLNQPIAPAALNNPDRANRGVVPPIPPADIRMAVARFIDNLNGNNFDYDIHQSDDENDQRIVSFSLVLEYLEVEFYTKNLLKFARSL